MFGVPLKDMTSDLRRRAKTINFGIIYGISAFGLADRLGIGREEASAFIKQYFERFPGIRAYIDDTKKLCRDLGYVTTLFGRVCHYPQIRSNNPNERASVERQGVSTLRSRARPPTSSAGPWSGWSRRCGRKKLNVTMLLQVHDELVFEAPEDEVEKALPVIRRGDGRGARTRADPARAAGSGGAGGGELGGGALNVVLLSHPYSKAEPSSSCGGFWDSPSRPLRGASGRGDRVGGRTIAMSQIGEACRTRHHSHALQAGTVTLTKRSCRTKRSFNQTPLKACEGQPPAMINTKLLAALGFTVAARSRPPALAQEPLDIRVARPVRRQRPLRPATLPRSASARPALGCRQHRVEPHRPRALAQPERPQATPRTCWVEREGHHQRHCCPRALR